MTVTRRDVLRLAAAVAAVPLAPGQVMAEVTGAARGAPTAGRFFSASEMMLLDELTELIIPADEHSPGARGAGVAAYIDGRLGEYDPEIRDWRETRERWKAGLAAMDALSREASGKGLLDASVEDRSAVLARLAVKEEDPRSDEERFFVELKTWTARGYYTSRIGLHKELEYKGNTLLTEFEGVDPATLPSWKGD